MLNLNEELADHQDDELPRVLCVDDDPEQLDIVARTLLKHGFDVTTASRADLAMREIVASAPFAVVVADLHLPVLDGVELLRWVIRNSPDTAGILLTGNANLADTTVSVNAGYVFRCITNPCSPAKLVEAVADGSRQFEGRRDDRLLRTPIREYDELTGLPDRQRFPLDLKRLQGTRCANNLALIVIALDELELVRGTLGFAATDQLIIAAVSRLKVALYDPRFALQQGLLFRMGDRLAFLWDAQSPDSLNAVAEHLLKTLESEVLVGTEKLRLSGHAGIADALNLEPMVVLRNAEAACLAAIQAENPRIARFSASTNSREQRRLQLSQRIRHPQFTERLRCAYQPQWDFKSGEVAGLEALARWWDPELGEISPSEFISIAEEHETIAERLGERILSIACQQRLEWRQYLPDDIRVAVNISATQLRSGSLKKTVLDCLMRTGLPPSMLELEITESEALADLARADALLQSLRREGITIAIDDFGVGYSSLSYLGSLPATSLKVDRAFIVGINENRRRADLLRGVCDLGHALNMIVVIEGVESFGAAAWLRTIGFDRVQGFAIARPLAAQALLDWYENDRGRIARMLDEAGGSL